MEGRLCLSGCCVVIEETTSISMQYKGTTHVNGQNAAGTAIRNARVRVCIVNENEENLQNFP